MLRFFIFIFITSHKVNHVIISIVRLQVQLFRSASFLFSFTSLNVSNHTCVSVTYNKFLTPVLSYKCVRKFSFEGQVIQSTLVNDLLDTLLEVSYE